MTLAEGAEKEGHEHDHDHEHEHEEDDGLPAHRIALRSLVRGATAGLCVAAMTVVLLLLEAQSARVKPLEWLLMWVGAATGCTLLVGADEVSRHAPPRLRLPAATLVGAVTAAVMAAAVLWLEAMLSGKGTVGAWASMERFFGRVLAHPDQFLPGAAALLIVFLALWRSRTIRPGLGGIFRRSLVGAAAGLASFLLLCMCWGPPTTKFVSAILLFTAVPAVAVPGLWLGGVVEARLLKWIERWRGLP